MKYVLFKDTGRETDRLTHHEHGTWPQSTVTKNVIILITESTILGVDMKLQLDLSLQGKSQANRLNHF